MQRSARIHAATLPAGLFLAAAILVTGCGKPNTGVTPAPQDSVFTVIGQFRTQTFAQDVALVDDRLFIAENYSYTGVYDFSDPTSVSPVDTLVEPTFQPAKFISIEPETNLIFVNYRSDTRAYRLDELTYANLQFGSSRVRDMLTCTRYDTVAPQYDPSTLTYTLVTQVILADEDNSDAFSKDYIFPDSIYNEGLDTTFYMFTTTRENVGLSYQGQSPIGLAFYQGPDTIAVGLADFGVGIGNLSDAVPFPGEWLDVVDTPGEASHLVVEGDYIYAADGFAGLAIIDAEDPHALEYAGGWVTSGLDHGVSIAVYEDKLALMDQYDGIYLLRIIDPNGQAFNGEYVEYMGLYAVREPTSVTFTDDGLMLVTSKGEGLTVLELKYPD